jgi:membrane associated rhomboid family serine protease
MLQAPGWNLATIGSAILILVYFAVWLAFLAGGEEVYRDIYLKWGGLSWEGVASGKVWQLVTHSFLHGTPLHLVINVLLFYYAAARLSHFLSTWRVVALFLLCVVGSGLAHVIAQAVFPNLDVLVGASGGITGLLLGFFSISPESRMIFFKVSAGNLSKGVLIASLVLFVVSPALGLPVVSNLGRIMQGVFGPSIFQAAHLVHFAGGALGWFLLARFLPRLLNRDDLVRMRLEGEARASLR